MTERAELITMAVGDEGVVDVRLNRPRKRNALNIAMFQAIAATIDRLAAMPDIRVVVLSGEGSSFCSGLDLSDGAMASGKVDLVERTQGDCNLFQYAAMGLRRLPVPVIAAIHGTCWGGGMQIALGADIRIVHPDASLALKELHWGLVPDMGAFQLLSRLIRDDVARELIYTARVVDGRTAVTLGLATRIDTDPFGAAMAAARRMAGASIDAIRAAKRLAGMAGGSTPADWLAAESAAQQTLIASGEVAARMARFIEKR